MAKIQYDQLREIFLRWLNDLNTLSKVSEAEAGICFYELENDPAYQKSEYRKKLENVLTAVKNVQRAILPLTAKDETSAKAAELLEQWHNQLDCIGGVSLSLGAFAERTERFLQRYGRDIETLIARCGLLAKAELPKPKRGRPKVENDPEKDARIYAEWQRAKAAGVSKQNFVDDNPAIGGFKTLDLILDRERKRRKL